MRAYFFGNHYLSSIQQGIQAAHCTTEMFMKYDGNMHQHSALIDWATNHKTMILLNGGYASTITDLTEFLDNVHDNDFPYASFYESEECMNGMQTCVGIILPQRIYEMATELRNTKGGWDKLIIGTEKGWGTVYIPIRLGQGKNRCWMISEWEVELINRLTKFSLAR